MRKILVHRCGREARLAEKCIAVLDKELDGIELYENTEKVQFCDQEYDYILVLGEEKDNRSEAVRHLQKEGVQRGKILPDQVVCLHGFSIEKYHMKKFLH